MFGAGGTLDLSAVSITTEEDDVAALLAMLVVALISWHVKDTDIDNLYVAEVYAHKGPTMKR